METSTKLVGGLLVLYTSVLTAWSFIDMSGLSRLGQLAYFLHDAIGEPVIDKAVLSRQVNLGKEQKRSSRCRVQENLVMDQARLRELVGHLIRGVMEAG